MGGIKPVRKYLIPDNPSPADHFRVCTYIPRDDLYLRQFFTSLAHFGKWVAWEESGLQNAKIAADRWKVANDLTHARFALGECFSVAEEPGPLDESADSPQLAWNSIVIFLTDIINDLNDSIAAGATRYDAIQSALGVFQNYQPDQSPIATLGEMYDQLVAMGSVEATSYENPCRIISLQEALEDIFDLTGKFLGLFWPAPLSNWFQYANDTFMLLFPPLLESLDVDGGLRDLIGYIGALPSTATYPAACVFTHTFDFTISDWGFLPFVHSGQTLGIYQAGVGWKGIDTVSGYEQVQIVSPAADPRDYLTMSHVEVGSNVWGSGYADLIFRVSPPAWIAFTTGVYASNIRAVTTSVGYESCWITSITVTGHGLDPW
jgi:hypothetical protein